MKPDLLTRFEFNNSVIVELQSDYRHSIMVEVFNKDDSENNKRAFHITPDEVDLFIAALNLYKNRIKRELKQND